MKYILWDDLKGTIIGLNVEPLENYYTLSEEAYEQILAHNSEYIIDIKQAQENIKNNIEPVIGIEQLITYQKPLNDVINTVIRKNYKYCNMYIEDGIHYNFKKYTYKIEDQINYEQILKLIEKNIITEVPIKGSEEHEYTNITIEEFKTIYNLLVKNKYYNLFYLQQLNAYVKTLTDENELYRLNYGIKLPQEYIDIINNQMEKFNEVI